MRNGKATTSATPSSPEEEVAAGEEPVEAVEPGDHPGAELLDDGVVGRRLLDLGGDLVRRALPDAVEPLHEDVRLGAPCRVAWPERGLRMALLEPGEDPRRVEHDLAVRDEHRHEILTGHLPHGTPVAGVDVDPVDLDALEARPDRDSLDVRRERDPVDTDHGLRNAMPAGSNPDPPPDFGLGKPRPRTVVHSRRRM